MPNNDVPAPLPETDVPITEVTVKIVNKKGLHARAAAKFVKAAAAFNARVMVSKITGAGNIPVQDAQEVSASSILGLMMLGAECNSTLRLRISGEQMTEAAHALKELIKSKFGEE